MKPNEPKPTVIQKNSSEEIHVSLKDYSGHSLIDVRTYWRKSDDEMIPTKKGVSLPAAKLDELIAGLQALKH